ncbi:MAG: superoxide dismutase [Candidatus Nanoarchaeia archaeon]|nr:superoxide dismutase [Candidatus Nanoarchaeia archaeon]
MHVLPILGYDYDSLEPYIDKQTMEIHHKKHHQTYVDNFNKIIEKYDELKQKEISKIIKDLNKLPEEIRLSVKNQGGGYLNHSLFWEILKKGTKLKGELKDAIEKAFGSFDSFKEQFKVAALTQFGSGWAWLVLNKNRLEIIKTSNQDNPLTDGKIPILMIDVWEHAYYLKYQNRRNEYVENFFNVINWDNANKNYLRAIQQ